MADPVNLAAILDEAITVQQRHLRELTASRHPRSRKYGTEEMATPEQVDSAQRALAGAVKERRSLIKDGVRASKKMTVEDMRAEVVDWFRALPTQQQQLLMQELMRVHNEERRSA